MTEFRVGDIVKIESGEEGKLGYQCSISRVIRGVSNDLFDVNLKTVEIFQQTRRVTVIKRAPKLRTALVKYDGEIVPVIVQRDGMITLPTGDTVSRSGLGEERVIETCPYVPAGLIERAEEWYAGDPEWDADNILSAIVGSVRDHRDGLQ